MNENVRKMIKNAIEENAVKFKQDASKTLYEKVGNRLKQKYIETSQKIFNKKISK
jgi:hypothetical protein